MPEDTHQALGFAWRDGSSIALPGKEALSALAPALMMEGPKGLSRSAMIEDLRDLQASIALSASVNFVQGNVLAPAAKFSEAAEMMARVLSDPSLPDGALRDAQRNRAAASQQAWQSAESQAQRLFARLVLGDGPYLRVMTAEPARPQPGRPGMRTGRRSSMTAVVSCQPISFGRRIDPLATPFSTTSVRTLAPSDV